MKQEKQDPEEKVLALKYTEKKQQKSKLFKGMYNKCDKYDHRAAYSQGNENKGNENKNNRKPRFNGECNNCGKKGHRAVDCWLKNKYK